MAVAALLSRGRFWGKSLLNGVVHLPLVLPPVVTGYVLLRLFGKHGPDGAVLEHGLGLVFAFRWTGAALAAAVMGFPLMVGAIRVAHRRRGPRLEDSARTLGANPAWAFPTVTLPLSARRARRHGARVREVARRVRRHHHLRVEHSRRNANARPRPSTRFTQVPGGDAGALRLSAIGRHCRSPHCSHPSAGAAGAAARPERRDAGRRRPEHPLGRSARRLVPERRRADRAVGPSGAGKTCVIDVIAGLIRPDEARIVVDGAGARRPTRGVFVPPHRAGSATSPGTAPLSASDGSAEPALRTLVHARSDGVHVQDVS